MLFVEVIFVKFAASRKFKLISVWAKTFINLAGMLPQMVFAQKQLHFVLLALLAALKAINTSKFTQLFS
jgi:hypothetical protein